MASRRDFVDALELQINGAAYGPLKVCKSDLELLEAHMCIILDCICNESFFTWSMIDSASNLQFPSSSAKSENCCSLHNSVEVMLTFSL